MELTTLDKDLLDGLQVLTDLEISRVQAHLAAGLPMKTGHTGYAIGVDEPSTDGCLVGVSMKPHDAYCRAFTFSLAMEFDHWVHVIQLEAGVPYNSVAPEARDRLAALLDMEWSRRVMATSNPVEQTHDSAIIPSLEAVPV